MCACIANGVVTCQQQYVGLHSHHEPGVNFGPQTKIVLRLQQFIRKQLTTMCNNNKQ